MAQESRHIVEKVQALSDAELATLLCLVSDQHCVLQTQQPLLEGLDHELQLIASDVFGLTCAVVDCSNSTTLDDFGNGILVESKTDAYTGASYGRSSSEVFASSESTRVSDRRSSRATRPFSSLDSKSIANVVIAKNLNLANSDVQIHALELIRSKRSYTRTAVYAAPKPFVFIALVASGSARLSSHLNDQLYISHKHLADDGFPNLDELQGSKELVTDDKASTSSVIRSFAYPLAGRKPRGPLFTIEELHELARLTAEVKLSSDVQAYLHNIVVFMRLHRAVGGGISALASRHLALLSHALAPLHGLSYVTPSLVALAARKIYPHRIVITPPERERSLQWGSSLEAVRSILEGVTPEDVIEEVLQSVEVPL